MPNNEVLGPFLEIYNYALLYGRRVTPTTRSKRGSAGSSLIQIHWLNPNTPAAGPEPQESLPYVGEIREMFKHKQSGALYFQLCGLPGYIFTEGVLQTGLEGAGIVARSLTILDNMAVWSPLVLRRRKRGSKEGEQPHAPPWAASCQTICFRIAPGTFFRKESGVRRLCTVTSMVFESRCSRENVRHREPVRSITWEGVW
ncbi:hypothetical protein B0H14DRAFT_2580699 [Mycena olivaceomarginata]|nr:hypothetical protein B0H14DRAFT_2580699 [Mycena olivaceomarginata]